MPTLTKRRQPGKMSVDRTVIEAAWLYYHDKLNQTEIAERLDVSRTTVVNYLQEARERGFVRVSLSDLAFTAHETALDLKETFGLREAYVVGDDRNPTATLMRVARGAAEWLPSLLAPGDRLGVAWGQTVYEVAEAIHPTRTDDVTVHQLVGSMATPYGFTAEICSTHLADRLGAACVNLHTPAILSSTRLADELRREPVIESQLHAVSHCNKAIFAAGSAAPDSHVVSSGVATLEELNWYRGRGATGVLCGRFIDAEGVPVAGPLNDRIMGITLDRLTGLDMGLLVSAGTDKVEAMRSVLKGTYATHLVTSESTARALLVSS